MTRARAALLAILVAVLVAAPVGVGRADTASDLDAARQRVADTQAAANAAAGEVSAAENRLQTIEDGIADLRTRIREARQRERRLVGLVKARALIAYTRAAGSHLAVILDASGPLQAGRRAQFLDLANAKDNYAAKRLAALRTDLRSQQHDLRAQRQEAAVEKKRVDASYEDIQGLLVAAAKARDDLIVKLEAERAAAAQQAAAEAAARQAAAAAELARLRAAQPVVQQASTGAPSTTTGTTTDTTTGTTTGSAGQIIANPGGGSFQCPVSGAAYTDSYGPRGSGFHYGIDMFAPTGTPLVAVKPGSVNFVPNEGAGGNTAYLSANDGNVYFYAHLSSFVGGARSVTQGEVIGLVGMTGNASGPHLHFEIRIGGANGQRIDPYPTLRAAGC
jgi:murein DD-endopeptidase MepM/ murein hydrolase activator NlpD